MALIILSRKNKADLVVFAHPDNSAYDAVQVSDFDEEGNIIGRGDFEIAGFRILANDLRTAKRIAARLHDHTTQSRDLDHC